MAKHYSELKAQIRSHWRQRAKDEMIRRGEPLPPGFEVSLPTDGQLDPPDVQRVARRACCLGTVALRGLAATWDHTDQVEFLPKLQSWFESTPAYFEIEKEELEVINAPASELDQQSIVNACWRWEGTAVLAAALGLLPLPPHDETVSTEACGTAIGLLTAPAKLTSLIAQAQFDPRFDRFVYADRALAIHWRVRQFCQVSPEATDFLAYSKSVTWANFNLDGVPLVENDLSIGGAPIARASAEDVGKVQSIASERHIAANWLIGWAELYSEVETPT